MGILSVNLTGSELTSMKNCYEVGSCCNQIPPEQLNAIVLDSPENPATRCTYSINLGDFLPLLVDSTTTCDGTYDNEQVEQGTCICYDAYISNKKINEANIPYIHGELVNLGKIPYSTLPTTCGLGNNEPYNTVLTKRDALGLMAQTARAITYDQGGWLNLWGYGDNGNMYIISSAQIVRIDEESQVRNDLGCGYPQSTGTGG